MWTPAHFSETDPETIRRLIDRFGFAALVTDSPEGVEISHLPLRIEGPFSDGPCLVGHVSRRNPQARLIREGATATAVFQGPHGYISPRWYREKLSVPTWDYAAVHVRGTLAPRADSVAADLEAMVAKYEGEEGWSARSLPEAFRDELIREIQGFELRGARIEAQFKLSQNHREDLPRVVAELTAADEVDRELGLFLESYHDERERTSAEPPA